MLVLTLMFGLDSYKINMKEKILGTILLNKQIIFQVLRRIIEIQEEFQRDILEIMIKSLLESYTEMNTP